MTPQTSPRFRVTPQAVFGIVIIVAGLMMTFDNLQWLQASRLLRFWPVGIVIAGALKFAQSESSSGRLFGGLIIGAGLMLTAEHTLGWNVDAKEWWLPIVLIGLGVFVIVRAQNPPPPKPKTPGVEPPSDKNRGVFVDVEMGFDGGTPTATADSSVSDVAIWAGKQRRLTSPVFRRGDLTAIMGGIELDLRGASTATGEAVIDLFVMWGGIEIWVPPDWAVSNEIGVLMAGVEDKSSGTQAARHRLIVRGFAIMGGVEIKT